MGLALWEGYRHCRDTTAECQRAIQGVGVESPGTTMTSGPSDRFYRTPADISDLNPDVDLGAPGGVPLTRGVQPSMYRARPRPRRQCAGFADATESSRRYRYLLSQGVSGLSVAFDLPTQIGYDSDHPLAAGEVGRVGVAIDSIEDMAALFDGIPLDR